MIRTLCLFTLLSLLLLATTARAATFDVDDTGEGTDALNGDGICATAGGKCTLRAAIQEANALAGADTINLPDLPTAGTTTHYAQGSMLPNITTPITIVGTSQATTRIESSAHGSLFYVNATPGSLTLQHLALTGVNSGYPVQGNGNMTFTDVLVDGNQTAGVYINGLAAPYPTLTLTDSTFSNQTWPNAGAGVFVSTANIVATNTVFDTNHAGGSGGAVYISGVAGTTATFTGCTFTNNVGFNGGAIASSSPALTIDGSTFTGNSSNTSGGALIVSGTPPVGAAVATTITNSTFDGNTAGDVSHPTSNGGAINALSATAVRGCTISNNSAKSQGGGIGGGSSAHVIVTNSTISGNSAVDEGGGLFTSGAGYFDLQNVTVTNNSVAGTSGFLQAGGGIFVSFGNSNFKNTIIAGNTAPSYPDCGGSMTSGGYNLMGDETGCVFTHAAGDQAGTGASPINAQLNALASNGGPTKTHSLKASSPAGDRGNPAGCTDESDVALTSDQRGQTRSVDGDGDGTARCDIGAYEAAAGTFPTPTTTTTTTTTTTSTTTTSSSTTTTSTVTTSTTSTTTAASTTTTTTTPGGSTTTTTTPPASDPVCVGGTTVSKAKLTLGRIAAPTGDETIAFAGTLDFQSGTPAAFAPATSGAQVLVEDLGAGDAALLDLTHVSTAIPGGAGCQAKDGWKKTTYKNVSNSLPPACAAKSAAGLTLLKLSDRRAKHKGVGVVLKSQGSSFATPVGPFRVTVVVGATAGASQAGDCAVHTFALGSCKTSPKAIRCK